MNTKNWITKSTAYILNLIYPRKCVFCHALTEHGEMVCSSCRERITVIDSADQSQMITHAEACYSAFYYDDLVKDSLHRYKFSGLNSYAPVYAEFLSKCIDANHISCDIITWVPISNKRKRKRGYDQSELLADCLSKKYNFPKEKLLEKRVNNRTQSGIQSADERKLNVSGVYRCKADCALNGKTVLLIDDIVTTGATLSECCGVLKNAGAEKVICLTVARTPLKKNT